MKRSTFAFACVWAGLGACGDNGNKQSPDGAVTPQPDANTQSDAAVPPDAAAAKGPVLRYDFEGSTTVVADSSGRGLDGTLSDVTAWTASGRNGRGIALAGGNNVQFVSLPNGVLTGVSDFTISTWINMAVVSGIGDFDADWMRVYDFGNGKDGADARFMFMTISGYPPQQNTPVGVHASSFSAGGQPENWLATQTYLPMGVWKHLAITGSGGTREVFIDGHSVSKVTGGGVIAPSEMEPLAGQSWIGKSRFQNPGLSGSLDDFRIYDRVLTQTEVADLAWPQHDYSYWRFDETSGQTATDSSDNAVPSVLMSGLTWTTGKLGGALDFPGGPAGATGPHVEFAKNPVANCTTQLTVAAWIKVHALVPWTRLFEFGNGTAAGDSFMYFAPTDGAGMHFAMVAPTGPAFDMASPSVPFTVDTWHHAAVTVEDSGMVTMYADGVSVKTQAGTGIKPGDFAGATNLWLGKSEFEATDAYLNAAVDDLIISCRAFTADEIKNLAGPVQ